MFNDQLLVTGLKEKSIDKVKKAITLGVDINNCLVESRDGPRRPVAYAAYKGLTNILQVLLNNGGDVNQLDFYGGTALHDAIWANRLTYVLVLCEAGANVNSPDVFGRSPLSLAMTRNSPRSFRILQAFGAKFVPLEVLILLMGSDPSEREYKFN
mgnify:CR=1 FL=1